VYSHGFDTPSAFFPFEPLHQPHGFGDFTDQKRSSIANILFSLGYFINHTISNCLCQLFARQSHRFRNTGVTIQQSA
jgi:hypothetical protein